ncbi:MAG: hypothetical protein DRI48_09620 [Chloroflexi bacterium]|nr:MAG: hypothetical protein DRI48_09620 [Chloroflexota bacterium]
MKPKAAYLLALVFGIVFSLYAATAAPGTLFGDPAEYQFVPAVLGIAHPPGYAFYTLLARLWQALVPVGTIAFRTNLLAAVFGAWTVAVVYLIVVEVQSAICERLDPAPGLLPALIAALSLAVAPDFWQHAIHANAHVVSVALAVTHLWLLIRWWRTGRDWWLFAFAGTLGLAATHHPITLMGVPAYGLFIMAIRPRILRHPQTLLRLVACLLAGLLPLLYYPLRSPTAPFGSTDMHTWEGFWRHVTARGLRGNLFHFGLADQPDRALVLWSLLRLQFPLLTIALIAVGATWLVRRAPEPALLLCAFLVAHLLFTLNTVQDVMAYLLIPFAALAILAGMGTLFLLQIAARAGRKRRRAPGNRFLSVACCLLLILPLYQAALNLSRGISLRDFTAAEEYVAAVYDRFAGRGEGAVLLSAWEQLTPLWVHIYTQGKDLDQADVKLTYVSTGNPWVDSVWQHIEEGPIYLPDYRPAVRDAGFRLVPEGHFYRVVAPPATDVSPDYPLDVWADDRVHVLGYDLPTDTVRAGEPVELVLYHSAPQPIDGVWMPYAQLGPVEARWTTDSRLLTHHWQPGEVVVERYQIPVPFTLSPGEYPLLLGYADLSGGRAALDLSTGGTLVKLTTITVLPALRAPSQRVLERALANLDNQIALTKARVRVGRQGREANWEEALVVRPGQVVHLTMVWRALAAPRDSLTIFVHLIDGASRPVLGHDYTPLGGACPTYLWFPKWLPGQTFVDPYRLDLPADLPAGEYWLEVGAYGMTSLRRLPVVDLAGNLAGDRVILGPVRVE